jgi:hypothetical protein
VLADALFHPVAVSEPSGDDGGASVLLEVADDEHKEQVGAFRRSEVCREVGLDSVVTDAPKGGLARMTSTWSFWEMSCTRG